MNQTQGLGNTAFSVSHKVVLEKNDRLRVANQLLTLLQIHTREKNFASLNILDIGCSSGVITNHIAKHFGKTIGIDIDKKAIKKAQKTYKRKALSFKVSSGTSLLFNNKSFDVVICNQVYSYASNPRKMIGEIYRVLKNQGICLFTGDNLLYPVESLYHLPFVKWLPKEIQIFFLKTIGYQNFYIGNYKTYWELKKLCANFKITDYTIKVLQNPRKYKFKKLEKYKKFVDRIPYSLLKLLEPLFPTFVFVLQKS